MFKQISYFSHQKYVVHKCSFHAMTSKSFITGICRLIKCVLQCLLCSGNSLMLWRLAAFVDFWEKKHRNARGFEWEFLWSCKRYWPGQSLKRRSKSHSLHSKKNFLVRGADFLWVTS